MRSHEARGLRTEATPRPRDDSAFRIPHSALVAPQSSVLSPQSLELRIEELVLHGFLPGDRYRIGEALERELARLFTGQEMPPSLTQDGDIPSLDAGSFQVAPGAKALAIGAQVARTIYSGIARG